jgi:hypothetical protein
MSRLLVSGVMAAAMLAVLTPAPASAHTFDKLAYLTFSAPVQIPGATLRAGTYRFHLTNPDTSRNVVQVLSGDGAIVYAMFHTIPDSRTSITQGTTVTFRETPAGTPPAVRSLFYEAEYHGYEFVYPKGGPIAMAEVAPQPEVTYTPAPAPGEPVLEPEFEAVAPEPTPEPTFALETPEVPVQELPRTATPVPFIAAGGLTSLLVGLGLGLMRRRTG